MFPQSGSLVSSLRGASTVAFNGHEKACLRNVEAALRNCAYSCITCFIADYSHPSTTLAAPTALASDYSSIQRTLGSFIDDPHVLISIFAPVAKWRLSTNLLIDVGYLSWIGKFFYTFASTFTRLSILFFYYRLTQDATWTRSIRWILHVAVAAVLILCFVTTFLSIFQCK